MTDSDFFKHPILSFPYECHRYHWELDETGRPTGVRQNGRRPASFVTPVPAPRKQGGRGQKELQLDRLTTDSQRYDCRPIVDELRLQVDRWRELEDSRPLARDAGDRAPAAALAAALVRGSPPVLLSDRGSGGRHLAHRGGSAAGQGREAFWDHLKAVNDDAVGADADRLLSRLAIKLATGAGKPTVMAMLAEREGL